MRPFYPDAFGVGGSLFLFRRDGRGQIVAMSGSQSRVWDLRFRKIR